VKVMIVDDNAEMRTLIRSLLSGVAQAFAECATGAEAVARFAAERPDWTLMDIAMPDMDGLSATRRIKAQFPEARILVITQHHSFKLRDSAREAGATGFLEKEQLTRLEGILTGTGGSTNGGLAA
jgi:CheY-like chemotaxis protein